MWSLFFIAQEWASVNRKEPLSRREVHPQAGPGAPPERAAVPVTLESQTRSAPRTRGKPRLAWFSFCRGESDVGHACLAADIQDAHHVLIGASFIATDYNRLVGVELHQVLQHLR